MWPGKTQCWNLGVASEWRTPSVAFQMYSVSLLIYPLGDSSCYVQMIFVCCGTLIVLLRLEGLEWSRLTVNKALQPSCPEEALP